MYIRMASARAGAFVKARKRTTREKAMEVIDVELLESIHPKKKGRGALIKAKNGLWEAPRGQAHE